MIQNIEPSFMDITFTNKKIEENDFVIFIDNNDVYLFDGDQPFPTFNTLRERANLIESEVLYLFAVDQKAYYLYIGEDLSTLTRGCERLDRRGAYNNGDDLMGFLIYTASHVHDWYYSNRFCGRCGTMTDLRYHERGVICPACGMIRYPQISPVVIVAIYHDDKLLLTKYANRTYDRYALVAGFVEIGESFEAAVKREVMEEVGLKVKNIRYFDSQPWGITGGLMAGFFAELDGSDKITLDTDELKEGVWKSRDQLPETSNREKSLTRTMMHAWSLKKHLDKNK